MAPTGSPVTERMVQLHKQEFTDAIEGMIGFVRVVNTLNGWFDEDRPVSDDIALLHSEVSEAYEAIRNNNFTGEKDSFQDECADILIRLLDMCDRREVNLTRQFLLKMAINETRGYRHGGKTV